MGEPAKTAVTYDDIVALPEHVVGEIVDGELIVSSRGSPRHARAASVLGAELTARFDRGRGGPGGWRTFNKPELHFGDDVFVPDLTGWRRASWPAADPATSRKLWDGRVKPGHDNPGPSETTPGDEGLDRPGMGLSPVATVFNASAPNA